MKLIILFFIVCIAIGIYIAIMQSKQEKILKTMYSTEDVVLGNNYFLVDNRGVIIVPKNSINKKENHIRIDKINDIKVYEDGKEKSAGKAIVGGLTFGVVGALVGSSMKTKEVKKMGIKIYTDKGYFDIGFLSGKCKADSLAYKAASSNLDKAYNIVCKYC